MHEEKHVRSIMPAFVAASVILPVVMCFVVIDLLIGVETLKRQYWIRDGIILSAILNGIFSIPLLHSRIRKSAVQYLPFMAVCTSTLAYLAYWHYMVAMIGI